MFVKVNISYNLLVEVDDKFSPLVGKAEVSERYNPREYLLLEELENELVNKLDIPTWDDLTDADDTIGQPYFTRVCTTNNDPIIEY